MTSEGLWEMFEGDSADTCSGFFFAHVDVGPSRWSSVRRPGSKDPHGREQKIFTYLIYPLILPIPMFQSVDEQL